MGNFKTKYNVEIISEEELEYISGGGSWGKIGGWITIAIEEAADIIISNGQNLVDAYNNGCKAAKAIHD